MATCAIGLVVSVALFLGNVLGATVFMRAAQDLLVERVRQNLQTYFEDDSASTLSAKRFLETLPSSGGDFEIVDHDRMQEVMRVLGEADSPHMPIRALHSARNAEERQESAVLNELERRALDLVREIRLVSATCALLFGLACWLFLTSATLTNASTHAARIAACGAALIGSGYAVTWFRPGAALSGYAVHVIAITTGVVVVLISDALFNDFRATRTALDICRFWP